MTVRRNISTVEYASARVRSHRAKLFKAPLYDELLNAESLKAIQEILESTKYRKVLSKHTLKSSGARAIGDAVDEYLTEEYQFCRRFYTDSQAVSLEVLSGALDIVDLKTVIRGKYAGASYDEIVATFFGPGLCINRPTLLLLAKQESLEDVVLTATTLNIPFAAAIKLGAERFAISNALSEVELSLDQAYFSWAFEKCHRQKENETPIVSYLRDRVDVQNIMTVARFVVAQSFAGEPPALATYYLEGGVVFPTLKMFKKAAQASSIDELLTFIKVPRFAHLVQSQLAEYNISDSLASLDRILNVDVVMRAINAGKREIESIGVSVAYLLALENEVKNIRLIAHAKAFKLQAPTIRKELVGV